jgi:hypothetical protein
MIRAASGRAPLTAIVAVVFLVTMSYGSVCSAMCAAGVCPNELQHSSDPDGCDQMPLDHSDGPQNHTTHHPDCATHHHPNTNIVKADNVPQFQLASAGHGTTNDALSLSGHSFASSCTAFSLSGLAPPPTLGTPLHTRVSVLRI